MTIELLPLVKNVSLISMLPCLFLSADEAGKKLPEHYSTQYVPMNPNTKSMND